MRLPPALYGRIHPEAVGGRHCDVESGGRGQVAAGRGNGHRSGWRRYRGDTGGQLELHRMDVGLIRWKLLEGADDTGRQAREGELDFAVESAGVINYQGGIDESRQRGNRQVRRLQRET